MNLQRLFSFRFTRRLLIAGAAVIFIAPMVCAQSVIAQLDSNYRPPQELVGSQKQTRLPKGKATSPQVGNPGNGKTQQQAFELLVKEIENLVPGKLDDFPQRRKAAEDAVTAFQLRDGSRVIKIFDDHAKTDADFPPTSLLLAGLSFAVKDPKSGRALLERAGLKNADSPAVYSAFARLALNEGRVTDALALLEKMARVKNESTLSANAKEFYEHQLLDGMTDVAMRQQRFADARELLKKQREMGIKNAKVMMSSAELEFKEEKIDKATEYLAKLRENSPNARVPETIIASWFQKTAQPKEAAKWFEDAAKKYPDNPQVQVEVANWAFNEENFQLARVALNKLEEASQESPLTKSIKAKIAFANSSYVVAEGHFEELTAMQPENFDFANLFALCLIESNSDEKKQRALDIANRNFRGLPNNMIAQATLGYIQLRLGETESATSALGRALQGGKTPPEINFFGAALLLELGQAEKAKKVLEGLMQTKGIFLYRRAARKMLSDITSGLPEPAAKNQ